MGADTVAGMEMIIAPTKETAVAGRVRERMGAAGGRGALITPVGVDRGDAVMKRSP
jgi:hypothetical protein